MESLENHFRCYRPFLIFAEGNKLDTLTETGNAIFLLQTIHLQAFPSLPINTSVLIDDCEQDFFLFF